MMAHENPRIVVVGACIVDLSGYCDYIPKAGETVIGKKFLQGYGGKGANSCVLAANLGASTAMISRVGSDHFGREYKSKLEKSEIDATHVKESAGNFTGVAIIMVDKIAENSIVVTFGATNDMTENDVNEASYLISQATILLVQLEAPLQPTLAAVKIAKANNVLTVMNLAPATTALPDIKLFDVIVVNESEMESITGKPVEGIEDGKDAVKAAINLGANIVILTLGPQGAIWSDCEGEAHHVPADTVPAVDSTGAGDAFVGALSYYMAYYSTTDIGGAVKYANSIAAISVQKLGTQASYPKRNELPPELLL